MDSGGYKLEKWLQQQSFCKPHTIIIGGATIERLKQEAIDVIQKIRDDWPEDPRNIIICLAAGICDLTEKNKNQLAYTKSKEEQIKTKISNFVTYFEHLYHIQTIITTIPTAKMNKYNAFKSAYPILRSAEEQHQLNRDINNINRQIRFINQVNNTETPKWDELLSKTVTKTRGKYKKNTTAVQMRNNHHLYDGVHPTDKLAKAWYNILTRTLKKEVHGDEEMSAGESDDDDDNNMQQLEEDREWDFKRRF